MTREIPSWLADNLEADVMPTSIRLDLELSQYTTRKTLPWHTRSLYSIVHILVWFYERMEVQDPGITIVLP
jgi:hypothetical protein